jgi:nitric oxide reductase NorD protein
LLDKNDPMLLLDQRFLMDFLTEDAPREKEIFIRPAISEIPAREEVLRHADEIGKSSTRIRRMFLEASESVIPLVSAKEFDRWALMGLCLLQKFSHDPMMAGHFFQSAPAVLAAGSFSPLKGWMETGEMIGRHSPRAAAVFFRLTPLFLKQGDIYRIHKWGEMGTRIMNQVHGHEKMAVSFFQNSIDFMPFMPLREIKDWQSLGVLFAGYSSELGHAFFSKIPVSWEDLNGEERTRLYRSASAMVRTDAQTALCLFMDAPKQLCEVGPHVRDRVVELAEKLSRREPRKMVFTLNRLISAVRGLSNPAQEMALQQGQRLAGLFPKAAALFFDHVKEVLLHLPEAFLSRFVDHGISLMSSKPDLAMDYFSLSIKEARQAVLKWKHAALLEDHRPVLAMFAQAMTGKTIAIEQTLPSETGRRPISVMNDMGSRPAVYLPPVVAGGKTAKENFSVYKAFTARQAGRLEFGDLENGLCVILELIDAFAFKDLAADIFFILDDGRIDQLLKQHYRGLEKDIETAVAHALTLCKPPVSLPLQEALVEILMRLAAGRWNFQDEAGLPGFFMTHITYLRRSLSGFYASGLTVWDCFSKMIDIYRYIAALPNFFLNELGETIFDAGIKSRAVPYRGIQPQQPGKNLQPLKEKDPLEIQVKKIGEDGQHGGTPLSLEELKQLIEQLREPLDLLTIIDGKTLSGPGVFVQNQDQLVLKAPDRNAETRDQRPMGPGLRPHGGLMYLDGPFFYDEWDHEQRAYRKRWCRLTEKREEGVCPDRVNEIYAAHKGLIDKVKKQFQRIRPDIQEILPRVEWGDEIDLSAAIQVKVDKKSGSEPSDRIFLRKEKKTRKIAVVFLVDMSASTGNPASVPAPSSSGHLSGGNRNPGGSRKEKKVMDIEIESLLVISEALEALNDEYAIFGFSGYGRDNVEFYRIKDFSDTWSEQLKMRIAAIRPKQSTRMGPAIRHAARKLALLETQQRLLILLSDGFPQDCDYGEDRTSFEYGLQDTMMALLEAKNQGISPFCITVDQSGNDYLKKMCDPKNYLVIEDIFSLPEVLPKVVESLLK